jgi:antitoxin (DNA-binding transcriptional repressor) of toxin-antitoxin stability system
MYYMKTVDVRSLHHHLGSLLDEVERGETLEIRRRKKVIARIEPVREMGPAEWPDLLERVTALYPDGVAAPAGSGVLYGDRD